MERQLQGKVALITGGSRGLGAGIAREFARRGANVAITYSANDAAAAAVVSDIRREGVKGECYKADQADPVAVDRMVKDVAEAFGPIDIIVNSAGISVHAKVGERGVMTADMFKPVPDRPDDPDEDVRERYALPDRLWRVNVDGLRHVVRSAARRMNDNGRVIAIGSMSANGAPMAGFADYCASKAAVAMLCRGWARDLGPRGITVNAVQPGPLADTDMNAEADDGLSEAMRAASCVGRFGMVADVVPMVAFLAGPDAGYITGAQIDVDGGCTA